MLVIHPKEMTINTPPNDTAVVFTRKIRKLLSGIVL